MGSNSNGRFADVVSQYTFGANILYRTLLGAHSLSIFPGFRPFDAFFADGLSAAASAKTRVPPQLTAP